MEEASSKLRIHEVSTTGYAPGDTYVLRGAV